MTRPTLSYPASAQQGWDGRINDNFDVLVGGPFPVYQAATVSALLAANPANYEDCLAATQDTHEVWMSDGSAWHVVGRCAAENCNGARAWRFTVANELTLSGADETWSGAFPAGSFSRGVSGRMTELGTSGDGGTGSDIGDGTDDDRYKANLPFTAGGTFTPADATADPTTWTAAAGDVVVTCLGGTYSGGKIRLVVTYVLLTAPTS